jgi:hypothetical protein
VEIWCTRAPVIVLFQKKIKNHIFEYQKNMKEYLLVATYLSHKGAEHQVQIICIFAYTKITNM